MIRTLGLLSLLLCGLWPAAAAERRYSVNDFDRIQVEGPYIVRLRVGRATSAVAVGGQAGLDRLSLDVSGRTLRIRRMRNVWGAASGGQESPLTIDIVTRTLRSARLVGPGRLDIDRLEGLRADVTVEGSGRIRIGQVEADNLSVGVAGSGGIELSGVVEALTADIQGSGDLQASGLRAENARVTSASSGSVSLEAGRTAQVTALGLGSIEISGRPACTVRGASADLVRCGALPR